MSPFSIRWSFDDAKLIEKRPGLNPGRIRRLYFEDAGRQWAYVIEGWPARADGSPLRLPGDIPFAYLEIHVVFDTFKTGKDAVARVDPAFVRDYSVAGPNNSRFPYKGEIHVDLEDIDALLNDRPRFKDTITHEIGHVLGIGTLFEHAGLVQQAEGRPWYVGSSGCRGYAELLGRPFGSRVPVPLLKEHIGSTPAYHWDETALQFEIMSAGLDGPHAGAAGGASNVISAVSAGALHDLGYRVRMSAALATLAKAPTAA